MAQASLSGGASHGRLFDTEQRLEGLAELLDDRYRIPGVGIRFGLDGLLGLIPVAGDTVAGVLSAYIVLEAWRLGIDKRTLMAMLGNVAIDYAIGIVPIAGTIFDVGFKANRRNVRLLRRRLAERQGRPEILR